MQKVRVGAPAPLASPHKHHKQVRTLFIILGLIAVIWVLCPTPQSSQIVKKQNKNVMINKLSVKDLAPKVLQSKEQSNTFDDELETSFVCQQMGRKGDVLHYYSTGQSACVPYPSGFATDDPSTKYIPPVDSSLTTVMATVDDDGSGPSGRFYKRNAAVADKVIEKLYPSLHARWFFESWRLWPGEQTQQCPRTHSDSVEPQLQLSDFLTSGIHNASLPNLQYDIRNFCVDELEGTLIGFEDGDNTLAVGLKELKARNEDPLKHKSHLLTAEKFLHFANREGVQIVKLPLNEGGTRLTWKHVISASIDAHHRMSTTHRSDEATPVLPPEIQFIEDQSLIIATVSAELKNPGHQFHRVGSYISQARSLAAKSLLVLVDIIAADPGLLVYRTKTHVNGNVSVDPLTLIPPYLRSLKDVVPTANVSIEPPNATPATTLPMDSLKKITTWPGRFDQHPHIHKLAAADAQGSLSRLFPFESEFGPLLSTGEEDCGPTICGEVSDVCSQERCGRPYALVNIALSATHGVVGGRNYRSDTQNYSTAVWGLAVREAMREAKRMRKDIWLGSKGKPAMFPTPPTQDAYGYLVLWRSRLVALLSSYILSKYTTNTKDMLEEYFFEYFAFRLEVNHFKERSGEEKKRTRRQLICYRRATLGHVFYDTAQKYNPPDAVGFLVEANCNLRDTLRNVYQSVWARYGMCMKGEEGSEPQKNTNRDAHPAFLLEGPEREQLTKSFTASKEKIDRALREFGKNPQLSIHPNASNSLYETIECAQKSYDDQLMAYFARNSGDDKNDFFARRPIRVFVAYRSKDRVLSQWRHHVTALMRNGIGKYIDFQFEEGLAGGSFAPHDPYFSLSSPLNTARARQYHTYLSTDIFMGPHGADMHSSALIKPSAFTVEIVSDWIGGNMKSFGGGFFSAFAYARNIGFLKVMITRKWPWNSTKRDEWETAHHTYMTLPDLKHTLSLSVCSWLAMNAVRLADEDVAKGSSNSGDQQDYSHLVPWWCRGGPKVIVQSATALLRERLSLPQPPEAHKLPGLAADQSAFFRSRATLTSYGLSEPVCPPLHAAVQWSHQQSDVMSLLSTNIHQKHLNRLQSDCARAATYVSYGDSPLLVRRRYVESLQSLLEALLLMNESHAQLAARLIIDGAPSLLTNNADPPSTAGGCGSTPIPTTDMTERDSCLTSMLGALILVNGTTHMKVEMGAEHPSVVFRKYLEGHPELFVTMRSAKVREELIEYIVNRMDVGFLPHYIQRYSLMETHDFGYGWKCGAITPKKVKVGKRRK